MTHELCSLTPDASLLLPSVAHVPLNCKYTYYSQNPEVVPRDHLFQLQSFYWGYFRIGVVCLKGIFDVLANIGLLTPSVQLICCYSLLCDFS